MSALVKFYELIFTLIKEDENVMVFHTNKPSQISCLKHQTIGYFTKIV